MAEKKNKSNKKFMVLSAIGILMVVDHHTFTAMNLFGDFIPYNSFFMPMFMFISGYFNKVDSSTKLPGYAWKKVKSLLVPYAFISLLVFLLQFLINWFKMGEIQKVPEGYLPYLLEKILTDGSSISLCLPMWFVISLFTTLMVYAVMKKLLSKIWNSYLAFGVFTIFHFAAVYLAHRFPGELPLWSLQALKCLFFLPFLELGILYRERLEKKHTELPGGGKVAILAGMLLLNMVRTMYLPSAYDVAFDSLDDLTGFTSPFFVTPMISSLVGILFWLTIVDLIGKPLHESRFVNYMSNNTFWIMGLHITFYNILNCVLLFVNDHITTLLYFDDLAFQESEWYQWAISPNFKLAYVVVGVLGPLGCKWICDRITGGVSKLLASKGGQGNEEEGEKAWQEIMR